MSAAQDPPITDPHCGCVIRDHHEAGGCAKCPACDRTPEYIAAYRIREFRVQLAAIREHAETVADAELLRLVNRWQL